MSPSKMAASSAPLMNQESPSKSVQELNITTGIQIPETYTDQLPNKASADDDSHIKYMDSCIIDLSLLSAASSSQLQHEELQKLRSVLTSWSSFQLINHGLSSSLLEQIREVAREFSALPLEVKEKQCSIQGSYEGYGGDKYSTRLRLKVHPLEQRNLKFWPEFLPNFRETLEDYTVEVRRVLEEILKAIAKSLNIEKNSFFSACGGDEGINMFVRFNYYSPCSSPDQVLRLQPHSDGTIVTFLLQDELVEGLQVEKDNQWFKVPIIPDALFINVGDQLEIMSNGMLKSAVHKVVIGKEKERTSVIMGCFPHTDKEIGPHSELIDKEGPQLYKKVKNYFSVHFLPNFQKGESAIPTVKL